MNISTGFHYLIATAQTVLYIHISAEEATGLECGEVPSTRWSRKVIDGLNLSDNTTVSMEMDLE